MQRIFLQKFICLNRLKRFVTNKKTEMMNDVWIKMLQTIKIFLHIGFT